MIVVMKQAENLNIGLRPVELMSGMPGKLQPDFEAHQQSRGRWFNPGAEK